MIIAKNFFHLSMEIGVTIADIRMILKPVKKLIGLFIIYYLISQNACQEPLNSESSLCEIDTTFPVSRPRSFKNTCAQANASSLAS